MISFRRLWKLYSHYEAFALYDLYYTQLDEFLSGTPHKSTAPGDTRPLTWPPILFHCTSEQSLEGMFTTETLRASKRNGCISFTDKQIDELDRFKLRKKDDPYPVAIGYSRLYLEARGLFQPAYVKHSSASIKEAFRHVPPGYCEVGNDLGAFNEMRVPCDLPIADAAWILFARRNPNTHDLGTPTLIEHCKKNHVAISYWDRSHQEGVIREPVYRFVSRDADGKVDQIKFHGEYYHHREVRKLVPRKVDFPAGGSYTLSFPKLEDPDGWTGPHTSYQCAEWLWETLTTHYPQEATSIPRRIHYDELGSGDATTPPVQTHDA